MREYRRLARQRSDVDRELAHQEGRGMNIDDRKLAERTLHDDLRGHHAHDDHYTANYRFYSVAKANVELVRRWLDDRVDGKRVLDYCCGDGVFSRWIAESGAH